MTIPVHHLIEYLKYDLGYLSWPMSKCAQLVSALLWRAGFHQLAFKIMSSAFRFNWADSQNWVIERLNNETKNGVSDELSDVIDKAVAGVEPEPHTRKFFSDPTEMLGGVLIVLKPWSPAQRGVILLKYSYYFLLLERFFDITKLQARYWLVVEPSWNGYCEESILCFLRYPDPVVVLAPESHDRRLVDALAPQLTSATPGPSSFVDHRIFNAEPSAEKVYDLAIIAGWSRFKRHDRIFDAIAKLKSQGRILKVVLCGYAGDLSMDELKLQAKSRGILSQLTWHDTIPPEKVRDILVQSKLSILWSRYEGSPRVVTESMFCDVPCIVRKGLNYGERYHFVNDMTGRFADEENLSNILEGLLDNSEGMDPRTYVLEHMSCERATFLIAESVNSIALLAGESFDKKLAIKVNFLHGMRYFDEKDKEIMNRDYQWLRQIAQQQPFYKNVTI